MERIVQPELLDELPPDDPRAIRSRRDLRRVNAWMGNPKILERTLQTEFANHLALRIADIGAGDGELLLSVARRLEGKWRSVEATLVDRHDILKPEMHARFAQLKWQAQAAARDVFEWLQKIPTSSVDAIVANLFLHHFTDEQLRELFSSIAAKARVLIAVEPRRSAPALFFCRLLWLIGCNSVTRHDAVASVRAGFAGNELSALWPDKDNWNLTEHPASFASHLFVARKRD